MTITLHSILLLCAFVVFLLTALNVSHPRINLLALGLALLALAQMVT